MTDIFKFVDFKEYLRHYYEEKKKENRHFSYRYFAEKAGFNNKGFVFNIIKGTKKLTKTHCFQFSRALGHSKKEADYFECIVAYAQAKNEEERAHFLRQALSISDCSDSPTRLLRKDQYEFYATWYHSAVRSLINLMPVRENYEQLCRKLMFPVTVGQIKKSIKLLERLGLVARDESGTYRLTANSIRTSDEIAQTAKNAFHAECATLAANAIKRDPPATRNAVSLTMGISAKTYDEIVKETRTFIDTIVKLVKNDPAPERVYQYELLLFPLSHANKEGKTS